METLLMPSRSETSSNITAPDAQSRLIHQHEAHQPEPNKRIDNDYRHSTDLPDGTVKVKELSTLKTLLQAPPGKAARSFDPSPSTSMKLTSRWRVESESDESGIRSQRRPIYAPNYKVNQGSHNHATDERVSPQSPIRDTNDRVSPRSPIRATNDTVSPRSPIRATYDRTSARSPIPASNYRTSPQSPIHATNNRTSPRSPIQASDDRVSPRSPIRASDDRTSHRSLVHFSNDRTSPQSPIRASDDRTSHKSPVCASDDRTNHQSPIRAQEDRMVTSPVAVEHDPVERINHHDKGKTSYKHKGDREQTSPRNEQDLPLDLSCKNPQTRSGIQSEKLSDKMAMLKYRGRLLNGESGGRRLHRMSSSPADVLSTPILKTKSEDIVRQPAKVAAPFDPLFILSQVACAKLTELEQAEPEKKTSGKGKGNRSKKNKKGSRKSKKKDKGHAKSKEPDQEEVTIERVENGRVVNENPAPGIAYSHSGNSMYNVHENESKQNGYPSSHVQYQSQISTGNIPPRIEVPSKISQDTRVASTSTGTQSSDYMELSPRQKHEGSVNVVKTQAEVMAESKFWPFTCRVCSTRFKNAAFLKIHEKLAHENKKARTDSTGNQIKFVPKDDNPAQVGRENGTPNPFPIHWNNPSANTGGDGQQGYTAIPCILKVHRQTSTSEMSSSFVKMDGEGLEGNKGFQCKFEADASGRRAAEILSGGIMESAEFGSQHPRPKLEVDGSSYEIIKVERERSTGSGDNPPLQPSGKGVQHKFYLQICDRNQSGDDSTVKIERGTTLNSMEDFDDVDGKSVFEGNPNQIRVPTSLALKFIPGDSSDSQRQGGYQHKVYLKIADGNESSIQIKTGGLRSQSPSRVGGTAVKIESTFEHIPRQLHVNDTTRPHKCHYCPKHFPSISALTAHERIHTGEKPYECRFCGRAFYHQNDRRKHERIHTGEKPYECSLCGQKFTNKGQVKIHERNHTGERPYQCRHCHKCFKSISNVNRHEKIHTGLKPYTCPVCARGFSRREHVRTHEEICRKKMLEEDEELADDPIGDVKLPYYRKIRPEDGSPVDGSPPYNDQPPVKRSRFEDEARSQFPEEKRWPVDELRRGGHREFRRSYSEPYDMYDTGTPPEAMERDPNEPYKVSPLLHNTGPPVQPEAVRPGHVGLPTAIDRVDDTTGRIRRDDDNLTEQRYLNPASNRNMYDKQSPIGDLGRRYIPTNSDLSKGISANPLPHSFHETNEVINKAKPGSETPPVHFVPSSGDNNQSDVASPNPNDKAPLLYVNAPNNVSKPPEVVQRKPDSDKLSAHIEALEPYPQQSAMLNTSDTDKKEPRHYVCGLVGQQEFKNTKLSESIPESDRLRDPVGTSSRTKELLVADMYSGTLLKRAISIHMKTPSHIGPSGGQSPPVLTLAGSVSRPEAKVINENGPPKFGGPKSGYEEPPILSGPHSGRNSPRAADSPDNAPPLLERSMAAGIERPAKNMMESENLKNVQNTDTLSPASQIKTSYSN